MLTFSWEFSPRKGARGKGSKRGKEGEGYELVTAVTSTTDCSVFQDSFREAVGGYFVSKQSRGGRENHSAGFCLSVAKVHPLEHQFSVLLCCATWPSKAAVVASAVP